MFYNNNNNKTNPLENATMIQTRLMGHDWLVLNSTGFIVGHYKNRKTAEGNCSVINNQKVVYSPCG